MEIILEKVFKITKQNKEEIKKSKDLIEENMSILFRHGQRLNSMDEKLKLIPKLYNNVDKILKEVIEARQEKTFTHERIKRLEKIHGIEY